MQRVDIRPLKQKLRAEIKEWRRAMPDGQKKRADRKIRERLVRLREYACLPMYPCRSRWTRLG